MMIINIYNVWIVYDDRLFIETPEFIQLRSHYQKRWHELMKQKLILENCRNQPNNEFVRRILQEHYMKEELYQYDEVNVR